MVKRYPKIEQKPSLLEEPTVAYGISNRERVMESTISVDEYFDELIEKVRPPVHLPAPMGSKRPVFEPTLPF